MLEFMVGLYGRYIYRDGYWFDNVLFIDYRKRELLGESGITYDMDSIRNEVF